MAENKQLMPIVDPANYTLEMAQAAYDEDTMVKQRGKWWLALNKTTVACCLATCCSKLEK